MRRFLVSLLPDRSPAQLHRAVVRLGDPLVQVWLLVAFSVLFGLVTQLRSGSGKPGTAGSPARLLVAGASLEWTDDYSGARTHGTWRPRLVLAPRVAGWQEEAAARPVPDARPWIDAAAHRSWGAADGTVRAALTRPSDAGAARSVVVCWSGVDRGNARLINRFPDQISGMTGAVPDVVIGNGSWSGDGEVEITARHAENPSGEVTLCLIGEPGSVTPAQAAAAGEVLNFLEARRGTLTVRMVLPAGGGDDDL